jgi:hypothetical protein
MKVLLLLALAAHAQTEGAWKVDDTAHFHVRHEGAGSPLGEENLLERIYEALHTELWALAPWMTQTKVSVYVYSTRESFLRGRFHPPAWSGGLLAEEGGENVLAVYEPVDAVTAAHELTHLYFHSYFAETKNSAAAWLDEGLAGMLQGAALTLPDPRERGAIIPQPLSFKTLFSTRPGQHTPGNWVTLWYFQSASVVRFLKRGHIEGQFAPFCAKIRAGETLEAALLENYGYNDLTAFENAWLAWKPKKGVGQVLGLDSR